MFRSLLTVAAAGLAAQTTYAAYCSGSVHAANARISHVDLCILRLPARSFRVQPSPNAQPNTFPINTAAPKLVRAPCP
jgi:hypothetical protein